ncbi:hypothetical protein COT94_01365 [Candidatus Falkowbacteria bacterium CG10_big_fil_rev_8_21_14_0_10_37_14]|uniref:IPT/TIG domain-containing protein n=1 Tax=Candidatus Falkowbacteria bacterium CG10_big_fil_rev_8_21_14_0_10_37_14 TaxID=1974561 RepID=A0A2M6WU64_9BACT|nr:hypothetical protein [Candidatus Falkowbacteria bacterium]PIT96324.1 MAG: hypothetical protein COT94_01365 [Candidatus Falkowbacteria bacterium CG10_big_fil_rev_8_21_14_0_10_37_14]
MKKFLAIVLIIVVSFSIVRAVGQSQSQAYYSGDGLMYNNELYVVTANSGYLELFRLEGSSLNLLTRFKPVKEVGMITDTVTDAVLFVEGGQLMTYASSGNRLYKYNVTNPATPSLVFKTANTNWDWYGRLEKTANQLITVGSKGVKVWNSDLQVIDNYDVINLTNPYNVRLSNDGRLIFNVTSSRLEIFDRDFRRVTQTVNLSTNDVKGNRRVAYDEPANMFYVMDDAGFKRIGLSGDIYKSLKHDSRYGYDAILSGDKTSVYISNGSTIAKLNKLNFKFESAYENSNASWKGSWAMGMDMVTTNDSEKIVVFNNSGILILDSDLRMLGAYKAKADQSDKIGKEIVKEALSLTTDRVSGAPYSDVLVKGTGFWPNEDLIITFGAVEYKAVANANGQFVRALSVPSIRETRTDIKVVGKTSATSYSTSFNVVQPK